MVIVKGFLEEGEDAERLDQMICDTVMLVGCSFVTIFHVVTLLRGWWELMQDCRRFDGDSP